jgi:hypothetical protein
MRKLLILAFAVGCSNGSDERRTFHGTQALDRSTLEDHVYYIDLSVADTPLTAGEVQDVRGAIPVRLLAGDDFVAAIGQDPALGPGVMDRLMGVWKLNPVPNSGDDSGREAAPGLVVEWDSDVIDITPEDLDVLVDLHPGSI